MTSQKKTKIAILASGSGSNAEKIMQYFRNSQLAEVACVISNRKKAGVLERAERAGIESRVFPKEAFETAEPILDYLKEQAIDLVILAGFLLKVPAEIISEFPDKILNIHPALLPKYGGKGMYGHFVHDAVLKNKDKETGITIHLVNENYDEGNVLFQASCEINPEMSAEEIAAKVQVLEHQHFPKVIESYISEKIS
ncbi:phosphoribosylglycinamide formyltransferase [Marivirga lumbricoides]|uniref:Phosphoribosylglycinamide formyltransferase n=1 Tax=Marivirga lumbricoides TaxID=1046115 RepID=A0ABQ1N4I1_9BACT|nr:phosphoribosylglycinamide formyltransferase [Marivirga lumbricoides]